MKLAVAILNSDDANSVIAALTRAEFFVTKLSTTGGFLKAGNVTILVGLHDERLDEAFELISKHSHSRRHVIPSASEMGLGFYSSIPVQVTVGGATVFVLDVEQFKKF